MGEFVSTTRGARRLVGDALELLAQGLENLVDEVLTKEFQSRDWNKKWAAEEAAKRGHPFSYEKDDLQTQLQALISHRHLFRGRLADTHLNQARTLRSVRNRWAHLQPFSMKDALDIVDTVEALLRAVGAIALAEEAHDLRQPPVTPVGSPAPAPEPPAPPAPPTPVAVRVESIPETAVPEPAEEPADERAAEPLAPRLPQPVFAFTLGLGYEFGDVDRFVELLEDAHCGRVELAALRHRAESVRFHRVQRGGYLPTDVDNYVREVLVEIVGLLGA